MSFVPDFECSVTENMARAAEVTGSQSEATFWKGLPKALQTLKESLPHFFSHSAASLVLFTDPQAGILAFQRSPEDHSRQAMTNHPLRLQRKGLSS